MTAARAANFLDNCLVAIQLGPEEGIKHLARSDPALVDRHFDWLVGLVLRTPEPQGAARELLAHLIQHHPQAWARCGLLGIVATSCGPRGLRDRKLLQSLLRKGGMQEEVLLLGVAEHWIASPPRNLPPHLADPCFWLACLSRNLPYLEAQSQAQVRINPAESFAVDPSLQVLGIPAPPHGGSWQLQELLEAQARQGHLTFLKLLLLCLAPEPQRIMRLVQAVPLGGLPVFFQVIGEPLAVWATELEVMPVLLRDFWWPLLSQLQGQGQARAQQTCLAALQAGWFPDPLTLQRLLVEVVPLPDQGQVLQLGQDRWSMAFGRLPWPQGILAHLLRHCLETQADLDRVVCLLEALALNPDPSLDLAALLPTLLQRRSERVLSLLLDLVPAGSRAWLGAPHYRLSRAYCQAGFLQPLVRLWHLGGLDLADRPTLLETAHLALRLRHTDLWCFLQAHILTEAELAGDDLVQAVLGAALQDPTNLFARLRLTEGNLELVLLTTLMAEQQPQQPQLLRILGEKLRLLPPELQQKATDILPERYRSQAQALLLPPFQS